MQFITSNKNKFAEAVAIMPEITMLKVDLPEIQSMDVHEIVQAKLAFAKSLGHTNCFVEDTAFSCEGLGRLPGPFVKFFLQELGREGLYKIVASTSNLKSSGITVVGYLDVNGKEHYFEGTVNGTLVSPRGESGFGYDPLFVPDGDTRTYSEMGIEEKNEYSTRGQAVRKLKEFLEK